MIQGDSIDCAPNISEVLLASIVTYFLCYDFYFLLHACYTKCYLMLPVDEYVNDHSIDAVEHLIPIVLF